ncbi:MAG: TolC family protein [Tannerella sp.]|jgi:outer membrane protein TolC|nr:TolC family protein [Tannerella sp.]
MKRIIFTILIINSFYAASQEIFTLKQCIETGLERNYSIRIIKNESQIASNNATIGNAGYLPSVALEGGYSGSLNNNTSDYTDGTTVIDKNINNNTLNANVNLNWTLFDGFGIQSDYARLKELKNKGDLNTRIEIEDLVANITAEYYNLIRQRIRLRNLRSSVSLSKERLRIVEERYTIGTMSRLELQQAAVDFNADSSRLFMQIETVYASRIRLNELMGVDSLEKRYPIQDTIIITQPLLNRDDLESKTFSSNALLLTSHSNIKISELELKKARSRDYPYVRMNAGYGLTDNWYGSGTMELQKRLGMNYGVTVGIIIFDGFNRKREQRNARTQIENSDLRRQELELALKADLSNLWMSYRNNLELWNLEKENLQVALDTHEIAIERYKLGTLAGIELREAQNNLLEAKERQSIAEYNTKLCEISLLQISGQILNYLE